MRRLFAIAWLTWKAALRFRLFLVVAALLLGSVVGLPLLIKDDGTARGCAQILLTYTLSVISVLLGLSTLWLSCGTLARDVEECQIQMVAVKPVARWQIWFGKWLGIMSLNATLLALSGAGVYGLLQWRADRLPPAEQTKLREQVLVARGSAKPPTFTRQINVETDQVLKQRLKKNPDISANLDEVRKEIREQVQAEYQLVRPYHYRVWRINMGWRKEFLKNKPLQLRIKFNAGYSNPNRTYIGLWQVGTPGGKIAPWHSPQMSLAADSYHEFNVPANLIDQKGMLTIMFLNINDTSLLFPLSDGIEVLYPEGGFGMNFVRGLGIIFCWMALLAALGLTSASFLSFPVAAFFSLGILTMALSTGTLANVVSEGSLTGPAPSSGGLGHTILDPVFVPCFHAALKVLNLIEDFSPIDALSSGRSIPWGELGLAFGQIVLLFGGIIGLIGVFIFNRRELATSQGTQ